MIHQKLNKILTFTFLTFILLSCSTKVVMEEQLNIENSKWNLSNIAKFSLVVTDTLRAHNIYVTIENTDDYPYSNIYLFSHILFPNGQTIADTIEFVLANAHGEWTGEGVNIYKNKFPFKYNVRFPLYGEYTFKIEQAMRCDKSGILEGISSVGISIEHK